MATVQINPTNDYHMRCTGTFGASWNTCHDSTTASTPHVEHEYSDADNDIWVGISAATIFGSTQYKIYRGFQDYELTSIPAGSTIQSATINITGGSFEGSNNVQAYLVIVEGTFDSSAGTDWFNDFTGWQSGWNQYNLTNYSDVLLSWNDDDVNTFTMNSDAITAIQSALDGGTRFKTVILSQKDYIDSTYPTAGNYYGLQSYGVADSSNKPYLEVTYVSPDTSKGKITLSSGKIILNSGTFKF